MITLWRQKKELQLVTSESENAKITEKQTYTI